MEPGALFLSAAAKSAASGAARLTIQTLHPQRDPSPLEGPPRRMGRDRRRARPASALTGKDARRLVRDVLRSLTDHDPELLGLPDGDAVHAAVVTALAAGGGVGMRTVVDAHHSPAELAEQRTAAGDVDLSGLSPKGAQLYGVVLGICADEIVAYFYRQPDFVPTTLMHQSRQLADIDRQTAPQDATYLTHYRESVARHLDEQRLFGLSLPWEEQTYSLSAAYVNLTVETGREVTLPPPNPAEIGRVVDGTGSPERMGSDLAALLRTHSRVAIEGPAGCGKTTLMRRLTVHLARGDDDGALGDLTNLVPIHLPVRDLARRGTTPSPEEMTALVAWEIHGEQPSNWVGRLLRGGGVILLLDGLDEVPRPQRGLMVRWLVNLVRTYPDAHYVITARPHAMQESLAILLDSDFTWSWIEPMSRGQVDTFVERWHEPSAHPRIPHAELAERAAALKNALLKRRDLRRLATTPLLCAMLCALSLRRNQALPKSRTALYRATLEMLLGAREAEQEIEAEEFRLGEEQMEMILARFAKWMFDNGVRTLAEDVALTLVDQVMPRLGFPGAEPSRRALLDVVVARSGVLQMPAADVIEFRHPSFQDYLAAGEVIELRSFPQLAARLDDELYQDVFILAVGRAQKVPARQDALLTAVVADAELHADRGRWLLAAAAIADTEIVDQGIARRVRAATRELLPPQDPAEAGQLAAAGPFVLDLLSELLAEGRVLSRPEAVATARVARTQGVREAYPLLRMLATSSYPEVTQELVDGLRQSEDPGDYAREILHGLDLRGCALSVESEDEIEALAVIDGLGRLDVREIDEFDCASLPVLPGLGTLSLSVEIVHNAGRLAELPRPERLVLADTTPDSVDFLPALDGVVDLDLADLRADLREARFPASLVALDVGGTNLTSLAGLAGCTALEFLDLSDTGVTDLGPLAACPRLRTLRLTGTRCSDITPLRGLTELTGLHAAGTDVRDLGPVEDLPGLRVLDVSATAVSDVSPLAGHPSLDTVAVDSAPVADTGPIAHLLRPDASPR